MSSAVGTSPSQGPSSIATIAHMPASSPAISHAGPSAPSATAAPQPSLATIQRQMTAVRDRLNLCQVEMSTATPTAMKATLQATGRALAIIQASLDAQNITDPSIRNNWTLLNLNLERKLFRIDLLARQQLQREQGFLQQMQNMRRRLDECRYRWSTRPVAETQALVREFARTLIAIGESMQAAHVEDPSLVRTFELLSLNQQRLSLRAKYLRTPARISAATAGTATAAAPGSAISTSSARARPARAPNRIPKLNNIPRHLFATNLLPLLSREDQSSLLRSHRTGISRTDQLASTVRGTGRISQDETDEYRRKTGQEFSSPAIRHLDLSGKRREGIPGSYDYAPMPEDQLMSLLDRFPNLQSIDLSECHWLTDELLEKIARRYPDLRSINLTACRQITDRGLETLSRLCPGLENINLMNCAAITDNGLLALGTNRPNLQGIVLGGGNCQITEAGFIRLAQQCRELRTVDYHWITAPGFQALAANCRNLTSLNLRHRLWLTDAHLRILSECCPHLENLNLDGRPGSALDTTNPNITDDGLCALAASCHHIRNLNLHSQTNITDRGIEALSRGCPRLQILKLGGCVGVTDHGVCLVAAGCRNLEKIDLGAGLCISNHGLLAIGTHCRMLKTLNLSGSNDRRVVGFADIENGAPRIRPLNRKGVLALISRCPNLTRIDLRGCKWVTDDILEDLARRCPQLRELDILGCTRVTDRGLRALAAHNRELIGINVMGCDSVTGDGHKALAIGCRNLQRMGIFPGYALNPHGIASLRAGT